LRLFKSMGYSGGGLGKMEQGRLDPIIAEIRPPQLGLGFKVSQSHKQGNLHVGSTGKLRSSDALNEKASGSERFEPLLARMARERQAEAEGGARATKKKKKRKLKKTEIPRRQQHHELHTGSSSTRETPVIFPNARARPFPPDHSPDSTHAGVLIDGIPGSWRSRDLRYYFSSWIEVGSFVMFHYRHRASRKLRARVPRIPARAYAERPSKPPPCPCCCVAIVKGGWIKEFIAGFDQKPWVDSNGDTLEGEGRCILTLVELPSTRVSFPVLKDATGNPGTEKKDTYLSRKERRELAMQKFREMEQEQDEFRLAMSYGEMAPPAGVPNGFIGTPSRELIRRADTLPPGLLKRLGVNEEEEGLRENRFKWLYETHPLDDDGKREAIKKQQAREATQEEWDRHLAVDPILDRGRLLGKVDDEPLFESKVDNPWDKHGAEGLVFYTDAVKWDAKKGDFDERTTDAWDVERGLHKHEEEEDMITTGSQQVTTANGSHPRRNDERSKRRKFTDGHIDVDYVPTTIYDRGEPEVIPTEEQNMGSFKLPP